MSEGSVRNDADLKILRTQRRVEMEKLRKSKAAAEALKAAVIHSKKKSLASRTSKKKSNKNRESVKKNAVNTVDELSLVSFHFFKHSFFPVFDLFFGLF